MLLRARWVLPIAEPPIADGWVAIDGGRIVAIGGPSPVAPSAGGRGQEIDLGQVAVLPGLVNVHTHLELTWLAGRVPRASRFTDWVRALLAARRSVAADDARIAAGIGAGIAELTASGTAVVGDVTNTLATVAPLEASPLGAVVFHELLRFRASEAEEVMAEAERARAARAPGGAVRVAYAAHAPYSVSPRLFQLLRAAAARDPFVPFSVHLGESPEEVELLQSGGGAWRRLLDELGAWDEGWVVPGCGPVEYLDRMKVIGPRTLVVHGTQLAAADVGRVAARGATIVTCPRSNRYVGVGDPPVARFYESGARVVVGTDSLASTDDLNLFSELREMRRLAPDVPAERLLASATRDGAAALGLAQDFGTIEPGRRAALIAVQIPPGVVDVEEYLVNGVAPEQVVWIRRPPDLSGPVRT